MKWKDIDIGRIVLAAQQSGKTNLCADLFEKYLDWISRGRPADEEIPEIQAVLVKVDG